MRFARTIAGWISVSCMLVLGFATTAMAWTKTYVVDWIEPAIYFDPTDPEAQSGAAPGRDCPAGVTKDLDYPKQLIDVGHAPESVQKLYDPEVRNAPGFDRAVFAKRGRKGEDVYREPWTAIEYPFPQVQGKIAYGFDLDEDPTTGFTGADGTPGVDNAYYKVMGCIGHYRGPARTSDGSKYANESMHNGSFTLLLVLEGKQDPRNDDAATLSFRTSPDKLVRDALGGIASDYSFRIDDSRPEFESSVPVKITNGVIESIEPQKLVLQVSGGRRRYPARPFVLYEGRLRFELTEDGRLEGLLGGYQPWEPIWRVRANYIIEVVVKIDSPSLWYALERSADGVPDPETGKMTAISSALRLWAVPAFSITSVDVAQGESSGASAATHAVASAGADE